MITEEQAEKFTFDVLDATKIVPEELVPVMPVGRLILNRNPDNFFAETEQVAFCTAQVVPGIDFSNDPLLAGRIHSYFDTQISRLGGPNFHELPINAPLAQVHNNQRDGMHRQTINRGRVAYEPNSLGGGCPFQAGKMGFVSFPEPMARAADKVRGKPERFADHYTQAHVVLQQPDADRAAAHHQRVSLRVVEGAGAGDSRAHGLGPDERGRSAWRARVAAGSGIDEMPEPMPKVLTKKVKPEVAQSKTLSLFARPGDGSIRTRRVAIIVADGVVGAEVEALVERLASEGAVPITLGARLGRVKSDRGKPIEIGAPIDAAPAVVFDAMVLPDGKAAAAALAKNGRVLEFLKDQYRHCKPILVLGASTQVLDAAGVPAALPNGKPDPGLIVAKGGDATEAFIKAIAKHRHYERESDPPLV